MNQASVTGAAQAEIATRLGRVRIFRQSWQAPIDLVSTSSEHWLQLSMLPGTRTERGCFPTYWQRHRFEPIGELFLIPAGQIFHTRSQCRAQMGVACVFKPAAVQDWLEAELEWTDARLRGSLDLVNPVIRTLLLRLEKELRQPGFAAEALIELISGQIAIELRRHYLGIGGERPKGGLAPWRLRLIEERLAQPGASPSLAQLAALIGLSVRQMERGFRASRFMSIGTAIAHGRIEQAKRLLASEPCVKSAAHTLGFASPSAFTAAFRRATGETPKQYWQRTAP